MKARETKTKGQDECQHLSRETVTFEVAGNELADDSSPRIESKREGHRRRGYDRGSQCTTLVEKLG